MPASAAPQIPALPSRRTELVVRPFGDGGNHMVKDPRTGAYYHIGEQEHFLLMQLDGTHSAQAIAAGFADRFGQTLVPEELDEFVALARAQGFLDDVAPTSGGSTVAANLVMASPPQTPAQALASAPSRPRQSILYWRTSLWDPDRLFTWLAPKL